MYSRMLLLRSLSLYGTRSPQELLKASGLTQVRKGDSDTHTQVFAPALTSLTPLCFFFFLTEMGEQGDLQL